eukprot:m.263263 g.263263  ORF g.263263 m.263263 type:complete len:71 (-) comp16226_c2_seq46:2937-3149(-)
MTSTTPFAPAYSGTTTHPQPQTSNLTPQPNSKETYEIPDPSEPPDMPELNRKYIQERLAVYDEMDAAIYY